MSTHLLKLRTPYIKKEVKTYERPPADSKYWEIRAIKAKEKQDADFNLELSASVYFDLYFDQETSLTDIEKIVQKPFNLSNTDMLDIRERVRGMIVSGRCPSKKSMKEATKKLLYDAISK